jgi:predicted  nucleic acid-binding Zn-ribbon protein
MIQTGLYILKVTNQDGCSVSDSIFVIFNKKPDVYIDYQTYQTECDRDSALLIAHPSGKGYKYKWSDERESDSIVVKKSGVYFVAVTDSNGCTNSSSIKVAIGAGMDIQINGSRDFCKGDSVTLTANSSIVGSVNDFEYLWSNNEKTKSIVIRNGGQYYVNVTHKDGCKGNDTTNIKVYDIPDLKLNYNGKISICSNDTLILEPDTTILEYHYFWIDGFNQIKRKISKSGVYTLIASNGNFCADTASVEIEVVDLPKVTIVINGKSVICPGEKTELSASDTNGLLLDWSTGENNSKININMPGIYTLYYSNILGCKDSSKVLIEGSPDIKFNIITSNVSLCQGDSAVLSTDKKFAVYNWSNGEKTETITVHQSGTYTLNIIDSNGCTGSSSIQISEHNISNTFKITGSTYSTDCNLKINVEFQIQNISEHDFLINEVQSSLAEAEIINKNELLGIIPSNGIKNIKVLFNFGKPDSLSASIKIFAESPCNIEFDFPVSAKSYSQTLIWADTLTTRSGSDICIPVYYKLLCPDKSDSLQDAVFTVEFNSDYFYPETVSRGTIISKDINSTTIKIKINVNNIDFNSNDSLLLMICGKALIGSKQPGEISISDFTWKNQNIFDSVKNGVLITEACAIDIRGIRLYKPTNMSVIPNPADEVFKINIITQSIGKHVIYIYNSRGELIKNIEFNIDENSPINQTFLLNSNEFNQGIYNIILNSPWIIRTAPLVIIR